MESELSRRRIHVSHRRSSGGKDEAFRAVVVAVDHPALQYRRTRRAQHNVAEVLSFIRHEAYTYRLVEEELAVIVFGAHDDLEIASPRYPMDTDDAVGSRIKNLAAGALNLHGHTFDRCIVADDAKCQHAICPAVRQDPI